MRGASCSRARARRPGDRARRVPADERGGRAVRGRGHCRAALPGGQPGWGAAARLWLSPAGDRLPVGGLAESVIDGETGWICARPDVEALAGALAASIDAGPAERLRRGEQGPGWPMSALPGRRWPAVPASLTRCSPAPERSLANEPRSRSPYQCAGTCSLAGAHAGSIPVARLRWDCPCTPVSSCGCPPSPHAPAADRT